MKLSTALAPIGVDEFRQMYLDKQWTIIPGPAGRFEPLLSWAQLNAALSGLRMPAGSPRLRLVKDATEVPATEYLHTNPSWGSSIRTGAFERQLSDGATLVLNQVDELFNQVRELTEDAEQVFGRHVWANLYSGWRLQKGFDLHWDDHDTLILQVYGRKQWRIYAPTCDAPVKEYAGSRVKPKEPPLWDGVLEAGSLLYMPRGWWHVAVPMDEPTLHITLGLRAQTGDLLVRWLGTRLSESPVFRKNIPFEGGRPEQTRYLDGIRQAILTALSDDCLDAVKENIQSEMYRSVEVDLPSAVKAKPSIKSDSLLLLSGARGVKTRVTEDGRLGVSLNGREWFCSTLLRDPLLKLNGVRGYRLSELAPGLPPAALTELKLTLMTMLMAGELVVRTPRDEARLCADTANERLGAEFVPKQAPPALDLQAGI
jgi:hypothetical protein